MAQSNYFPTKKILYSLFALIFFQNAFVLSVGGSIKWYELLGILLGCYIFISPRPLKCNKSSLLLLLVFVVSPTISDLYSLLLKPLETDIYELYARRFPEAKYILRVNYYFSLIYNFVMSLTCFASLYFVVNSNFLYKHYKKTVRFFIYAGTLVACYSFYQYFGIGKLGLPDIVPSFLDARNFRGSAGRPRAGGFSIEPGSYIIIQSIVAFYLMIHKGIFPPRKQARLFLFNFFALMLTLSSSLIATFFAIFVYGFFFSRKRKVRIGLLLLIILLIIFFPVIDTAMHHYLRYAFFTKVQSFLSAPSNTQGSGAYRAFTSGLGYKIFRSKPIFGCGLGNSFSYMPLYEYTMGITAWGERLGPPSTPQNAVSKILAEQGLFGGISYFALYFFMIRRFFRYRRDVVSVCYLIIAFFLFACNFVAGAFITNLFLWLNLALGLNYVKHRYGVS